MPVVRTPAELVSRHFPLLEAFRECRHHGLKTWLSTNKQIVFISLYVITYFTLGVAIFARLESWTFTESLYFNIITVSTIGYGDYIPTSIGAKIFSVFHTTFGMGLFTLLLGSRFRAVTSQDVVLDGIEQQLPKEDFTMKSPYWLRVTKRFLKYFSFYLILLVFGVLFYAFSLHYKFYEALYLATVTGTSVGYGDVVPSVNADGERSFGGMWFTIVYAVAFFIFTIHVLGYVASQLYNTSVVFDVNSSMEGALSPQLIQVLDANDDDRVDRAEWLEAVLIANGVVAEPLLRRIRERFQQLDTTGDGVLTKEDIQSRSRTATLMQVQPTLDMETSIG
eukprot:m.114824 g.114824  ORF g.114824 m.114824 type:complete len:336 (-) comp9284_c0_seq2:1299-2306(-)